MRDLENADFHGLDAILANGFATLTDAREADLRLALLRLVNGALAGVWRVDAPPGPAY
jgi:hypothetical protein